MLIDHVDLTVPPGTFTVDYCADLDKLLTGILGWPGETRRLKSPLDGALRVERVYRLSNQQFVVLREAAEHLVSGFEDHIGLMVEPPELDRIFEECRRLATEDSRVELAWIVDDRPLAADLDSVVIRGFFVRFVMPIWLDIQTRESQRA